MIRKRHPLVIIREELGISRRDFALMCNLSYGAIYRTECAFVWRVPGKVLAFLEELNYDGDQVQWAHQDWCRALGAELRQRVFEGVE